MIDTPHASGRVPTTIVVTLGSCLESDGCYASPNGAIEVYPAACAGDLAAEFTPPLQLVTLSRQLAAVPIRVAWLLGGVLPGLGTKAVGRRRAAGAEAAGTA